MSVKKIKDIMHDEVYSVHYKATIKEVLELMVDKEISGVPVVDDDNYVVGFISDGDIMKFIAKTRSAHYRYDQFYYRVVRHGKL